MAKLVSKTYGDALFEAAKEEDRLDEFFAEVKAVQEILLENPELSRLMKHPKIVKEEKTGIMEGIFKGRISGELMGLICLIIDKDHFDELDSVFQYFMDQVREYKNIGTALVTSAVELSETQKEAVKKRLLETTKYVEFEMQYFVDPSLIGGMQIRIGDRVVDSSIKTKLKELTSELSRIQVSAS